MQSWTVVLASAIVGQGRRWISSIFRVVKKLHPLYENIAAADEVLEAVRTVPGVRDAQPRITTGVAITADEEIGDEFALVTGATDAYYRQHLRGPEHLAAGRWLSGQPKEVVVGRGVAERRRESSVPPQRPSPPIESPIVFVPSRQGRDPGVHSFNARQAHVQRSDRRVPARQCERCPAGWKRDWRRRPRRVRSEPRALKRVR